MKHIPVLIAALLTAGPALANAPKPSISGLYNTWHADVVAPAQARRTSASQACIAATGGIAYQLANADYAARLAANAQDNPAYNAAKAQAATAIAAQDSALAACK